MYYILVTLIFLQTQFRKEGMANVYRSEGFEYSLNDYGKIYELARIHCRLNNATLAGFHTALDRRVFKTAL